MPQMSQNAFTDFSYIFLNKCFFFWCILLRSFLDTYFPIIFSSLSGDWVHGASHVAMLPAELPKSFYILFLKLIFVILLTPLLQDE